MTIFRIAEAADLRLDEIYHDTSENWGEAQADAYIRGLYDRFQAIADRATIWRAVPAEFGVEGYYCRYERHFIYWRVLSDGAVGIVTILHERMHQNARFAEDQGG